jgi:hypothetical protein
VTVDFADFLASLNSEGVGYVVIDGIAMMNYVPYRTTRDLDELIEMKATTASPEKDLPDLLRLRALKAHDRSSKS